MSDTPTSQLAERPQKTPVLADGKGVKFNSMEDMWRFCTAVVNSQQIKDISSPEVALIRLQAGLELGLSPIWSLTNIMVTNGRPSVWGDALLGLVRGNPHCEDVIEEVTGEGEAAVAKCEVRRKGCVPVIRTFSVADAKKAGLWGKSGPWTNYPKRMLQMRARAFACRDAFADALRGLSCREEIEDIPKANVTRVSTIVEPPSLRHIDAAKDQEATKGLENSGLRAPEPVIEAEHVATATDPVLFR